jgi:hypothetical protein
MKLLYPFKAAKLVIALVCLGGTAFGQAAPPPGHFRFVNAAGLAGKISLTVDALKLKPEGFASGETTGSIGILSGSPKFTVSSAEAGTATATLSVQPNSSTTMIAYTKVTVDARTNTIKKALQLLPRVNPPVNNGRHFQLLYVSSQAAVDVVLNGTPQRINAMREVNGQELPGGDIKVEQAGKVIVTFTAPQAGNFLVLLYDDAAGKLAGVVLADYK